MHKICQIKPTDEELCYAVGGNQKKVIDFLIDECGLNSTNSALEKCVSENNINLMIHFIEKHNEMPNYMHVLKYGNFEMLKYLIDKCEIDPTLFSKKTFEDLFIQKCKKKNDFFG